MCLLGAAGAGVPLLLAGCAAGPAATNSSNALFSISPGTAAIDTNCTGCNTTMRSGKTALQFHATLANGQPAQVFWSLTGGDPRAGAGSITGTGLYSPPSYLTRDRAELVVTASLKSNPAEQASAVLNLTPGFGQPLTPENAATGAGGTVNISGLLAEAGGSASIRFELAGDADGSSRGAGSLGSVTCQRAAQSFTTCTVAYTAPVGISSSSPVWVVAHAGGAGAKASAVVLVNPSGVQSSPATHQAVQTAQLLLGGSGGNNADFDAKGSHIVDCCSGTLGALVADTQGRQYVLSNNHVLARSDHAAVSDTIVAPGLIDNNCTPYGEGSGVLPVATLSSWLPLRSKSTNADAALAVVASRAVDAAGSILELGSRQADGTLAAAPPGTSSSGGKGEAASIGLRVAKSGRTTGLTCGSVSAVDLDVVVDYYLDCAETKPYLSRTFTHQLGVSGNQFADAGDSGALVVNAANAEPVGLYFAGGTDAAGVSHGMATPAPEVLAELGAQTGSSLSFVGAADHAVSCLSYGDATTAWAQSRALDNAQIAAQAAALNQARMQVNPRAGILGVAMGKSADRPGSPAVVVYTDASRAASVQAEIRGVRTVVVPSSARAVALGSASHMPSLAEPLASGVLATAIERKNQAAAALMRAHPAFFGIGVGRSLDDARQAALVVFVDRRHLPATLPVTLAGLRTRYVIMDRLHVTRSYAVTASPARHCSAARYESRTW
jgi:hypothetical protein